MLIMRSCLKLVFKQQGNISFEIKMRQILYYVDFFLLRTSPCVTMSVAEKL